MSKRNRREHGRILSVETMQRGSALDVDAAAGATTITVTDAGDFDEEGGWLYIGAQVVEFTACDDDTGVITLASALTAAGEQGDPVYVYDTLYGEVVDYQVALVQLDGDYDNPDPVEAEVAEGVDDLPEGDRGGAGESCMLLRVADDEWEIVGVGGRPRKSRGVKFYQDTQTATPGDQSIKLTHLPVENSEHVYWRPSGGDGIYVPGSDWSRTGQTITVPDPDGLFSADSGWVKNNGTILEGDGSVYEQDSIQEMNVLPDPTGQAELRVWYTGGWIPAAIATATSNDGGYTWTRGPNNPVVGQGAAGVATDVAHTGLQVEGDGTIHITYTDPNPATTTLNRVTSTDGGLTFGNPVTVLTPVGWEGGRWGNTATVIKDGVWHMLYDAMDLGGMWEVGYATSPDGVTWTRQNGGNPLTTLQRGSGMYGGCDLHLLDDGSWEVFYHASPNFNLPTYIYRATSADLINWTHDPVDALIVDTLDYEYDQVADPHVISVGGKRTMFYEGVNNPAEISKANLAVLETPDEFTVEYAYRSGLAPTQKLSIPLGEVWKYQTGLGSSTTYAATGFDDTAWSTGATPFGWGGYGDLATTVPKPVDLWYRITAESFGGKLHLRDYHADNNMSVYIDGALVATFTYTGTLEATVDVPAGVHTFAVRATDDGVSGGYSGLIVQEL